MPVQGRAAGPSGYAPSARQPLEERQDNTSQDNTPQVVTPLWQDRDPHDRDPHDRDPGASLSVPPSRGATSLRDALSSREGLASRTAPPSHDIPSMRSSLSSREGLFPRREGLPSRDAPPLRPTLFPREGLPTREATSLRDTPPPSLDPELPPAPPDLNSSAEPYSPLDDGFDFGFTPPREATSRREAGPSVTSRTGSASTADAAWKRNKRRPEVFEGDAALKELWSRLAEAPADETPEPTPPRPVKAPTSASTARFKLVVLAAGGVLGFLWVTPANQQASEGAAVVSAHETPSLAARNIAAEQGSDPSVAAEQAASTGAALYQDFLKWRQRHAK